MAVQEETRTELGEQTIQSFAASLRGQLIRPADPAYDDARRIWNGMIDRYPALIARCTGVADVIAAVNFARDNGLLLAVRGGGHNVAGNAICDGGLVIDLSPMRGVHVDPRARVAYVQGGATWADVDRETQVFGLATPSGLVSTTGVAGLTLHGGVGYLRGKYGLSIDNLRTADIVTADGQVRHASAEENADLFWAVRGAGSNFGVVTSFEFALHPVGPTVMLCVVSYALEDAPTVLRKWRDFTATAPTEFTSTAVFMTIPEGFPPELVGRPVVGIYGAWIGPMEEGERITRPVRELASPVLDMSGPMPYTALQSGFDAFFPAGVRRYWKATFVDELSDDVIDAYCRVGASLPDAGATAYIWPQGGVVTGVGAEETAFGVRHPFMFSAEANWTDAAEDEAQIAWARDMLSSMRRFSSGGVYLNFPGFGEEKEEMARAAYGANYPRLQALKARYDPTNLFRMNINIRPAT
jgi:FAD/FMN-containing dehydrogenase